MKTAKRFPSGGPNVSFVRFSMADSMTCWTSSDDVLDENIILRVFYEDETDLLIYEKKLQPQPRKLTKLSGSRLFK